MNNLFSQEAEALMVICENMIAKIDMYMSIDPLESKPEGVIGEGRKLAENEKASVIRHMYNSSGVAMCLSRLMHHVDENTTFGTFYPGDKKIHWFKISTRQERERTPGSNGEIKLTRWQ